MKKNGVEFEIGNALEFTKEGEKIKVKLEVYDSEGNKKVKEEEFDNVLQAIGRTPETKTMGLENVSIKLTKN